MPVVDEGNEVVSAIVVNRDTKDMLAGCLESLRGQDYTGGLKVWVVDNNSRDGSREMTLHDFNEVNLIQNLKNVGYARACNQGIRSSGGEYVLVLNSDTELSADTVSTVVDFFEGHPEAGAVGVRLLNADGSLQMSCREFPNMREAVAHGFIGLFRPDNPTTRKYRKTDWDHGEVSQVDWVSGAFLAFRRKSLEEVGGFDEKYFMYVEDVDLCRRLWDSGWKVYYLSGGEVVHHVAQSSSLRSNRMIIAHHRSMFRYYRKHNSGRAKAVVTPVVFLGVSARAILVLLMNLWARIKSAVGGEGKIILPGRR